jgi:uncharacterized protein (DUF1697 family)
VPTWVSLLRAVNLGAHNKVPMPALRSALSEAGFERVRTYVASGNVVTSSRHRSPGRVAAEVRRVIAELTGLDIEVMVRSPEDMDAVVAANPWPDATRSRPKLVAVSFLSAAPSADRVEALHAETSGSASGSCLVIGRELYVDYVDQIHGSRFSPAFFERWLAVSGTTRNWRTVEAIVELCRARP